MGSNQAVLRKMVALSISGYIAMIIHGLFSLTPSTRWFIQRLRHGVNWHQRDLKYVRKLIYINQKSKDNLHTPRQSTNWYLMQLPEHATISHNLYRLPMVSKFLIRYAENVTEYQLRRICSAVEILFTNTSRASSMAHFPLSWTQ